MGRVPQEIIDQILDRVDIVEVIAGYIQLKRLGRNFKACCPFHTEKTPSFVVSPDKQIYHCFGCGAGGNSIGFVMSYENLSFPDAVKMMAAKAGVELKNYQEEEPGKASLTKKLYDVNSVAASFYQGNLKTASGKQALEYLKNRGFDQEVISEFKLGYALKEWESFRHYAEVKKVPIDILRQAGLVIQSDKGKKDYDRFRGRIIFPIFNERGYIAAFGARVMDNSLPKYINSPETSIYSKSNVLYGLNFGKKEIRDAGYVLIVEGYMDVIIPFQHGVKNVVATSGTALTERQVLTLKKYTDTAVMIFDSDQAGEAASLRGLDILVSNGMNVRIVTLPEGQDPDSFIRKFGKSKFDEAVKKSKDLFDYKLDLLIKKLGAGDIHAKAKIVDEMLPTIAKIENKVTQSAYLKKLTERLGVHEESLRYEMGKVKPDYSYHYESEAVTSKKSRSYKSSELHLLGLSVLNKKVFEIVDSELGMDMFRDKTIARLMRSLKKYFESNDKMEANKLLSRLEGDEEAKAAVMQALAKADITDETGKAVKDCIFCVKKENREEKLKELNSKLKKAEKENNSVQMKELLAEINKIHKEKVG